jgi:hypothetical protein
MIEEKRPMRGVQFGSGNKQINFFQFNLLTLANAGKLINRVLGGREKSTWKQCLVYAAAPAAGAAVFLWWPWQWRPESLDVVPDALPFVLRMLLLLTALRVFLGTHRPLTLIPVTLLVASLFVAPPEHARPPCGSATVISQASVKPWTDAVLELLVQEDAVECIEALRVVRDDGALAAALKSAGAAVSGIITSDPEVIRNLDPRPAHKPVAPWGGVEVAAEPVAAWTGIGRDVATVSLGSTAQTARDSSVPFGRSVPLTALSTLPFRAADGNDAIGAKIAGLGRSEAGRLRPDAAEADAAGPPCPNGVLIPSSWAHPSCAADEGVRATVLDGAGHPIGVPVLGIPLQASVYGTGPAEAARQAVTALFARLRKELRRDSYLIALTGEVAAAVAESESLRPLVVPPPVHLIVVVDASLSTGRLARGGVAPLEAALAGLRAFASGNAPRPGDRLSVLTAQGGREAAARTSVERPLPTVAPGLATPVARGETALPTFLAKAEGLPAGRHRTVRLLLTDGVNVFDEHKLKEAQLRHLTVLAIGNRRGCDVEPRPPWQRCLVTPASPGDVAAQIARVFAGPAAK